MKNLNDLLDFQDASILKNSVFNFFFTFNENKVLNFIFKL